MNGINWSAPFPDVMRAWQKVHGLNNTEAAVLLGANLESYRCWRYRKRECSQAEAYKKLMRMIPERQA
jgi:hypothetical protein